MATPFSSIYSAFMNKVTDYSFINLSDAQLDAQNEEYMWSAIVWFTNCKVDLTQYDDIAKQFTNTLSRFEIEIISSFMVVEFLRPRVTDSQLYRQTLTDAEFKQYSQANQIDSVLALFDKMEKNANKLMVKYSLSKFNVEALT